MITLAIDTSSPQASLGILKNGNFLGEVSLQIEGHHSTHVLPALEWMLKTTGVTTEEIDLFTCAKGPGSFTGLRIGVATVMGLSAGRGKPLVGVSTLEAVAYPYLFEGLPVAAVLDARKRQVFFQLFVKENGSMAARSEALSISPETLHNHIKEKTLIVGGGVDLHKETILGSVGDKALFPFGGFNYHRAHAIALLGEQKYHKTGADSAFELQYVRASDAELNRQNQNAGTA